MTEVRVIRANIGKSKSNKNGWKTQDRDSHICLKTRYHSILLARQNKTGDRKFKYQRITINTKNTGI